MNHPEWARCKGWIAESAAYSPLADSIATIEANLENGAYRLAASANSAAIVERARFGERECLIVRFGGGDLEELLNIIEPRLYEEAKAEGRMMMSEGRIGWLKPAQARGYKLAWITMIKE